MLESPGRPFGATPGEWTHFAHKLDLVADLLPVVSNPSAQISERSKMKGLGKTPSRYNQNREVVGIPKWAQQETTDRQVAMWLSEADHGICIQTRRVRAFDIDIPDKDASQAVRDLIELTLGELPGRYRPGTGKILLGLWMPGEFSKRIIRTAHGAIEFLATGQQFIAIGEHFSTTGPSGTRYTWEGGLPEAFPVVTPADFELVWQALVDAFALEGTDTRLKTGRVPVKPRVASDADQDATVTWLRENGWIREFDRDGRVHITCPWEDEHSMDSGPSATTYFPAGVGGFQQGHFRCLHAHCAHHTDGDFVEAMGIVRDEFDLATPEHERAMAELFGEEPEHVPLATPPAPLDEDSPWPAFRRDKQGQIESTATNLEGALSHPGFCGVRLALDEFKDLELITYNGRDTWRPVKDTDNIKLRVQLERRGFKSPGKEIVRDAIHLVAEHNAMDTAKSWAEGLVWDGVPRVAGFCARYWRTGDTEYAAAVSEYIWTALAARALSPGSKVDMVPVLVSAQGMQKTESVAALAPEPDAFVEIDLTHRDENLARSLRGKLVGELAELRGLQTRDAESIKAWITKRFDEWTPKYIEYSTKYLRRLVMFGTTNRRDFLDDPTGERRWLPIEVGQDGQIDLAGIRRDRDQLWAEGVAMYQARGVHWQAAETLAREEHHKFKADDPWDTLIADWLNRDDMDGLDGPPRRAAQDGWTSMDILTGALGMQARAVKRAEEMRLAKLLKEMGFHKKRVWKDGAAAERRWVHNQWFEQLRGDLV